MHKSKLETRTMGYIICCNVNFVLTLVQDEGHVALGHLVALLSQQQILDQRSIRLTILKAAVGRHETL